MRQIFWAVVLLSSVTAFASEPLVLQPTRFDVSPPVSELRGKDLVSQPGQKPELVMPAGINKTPEGWQGHVADWHSPHVLQTSAGRSTATATPVLNVEGLGNGFPGYPNAYPPPDTVGAVGLDHFVQWVNVRWAVFDKATGDIVEQPGADWRPGNSVWDGFGGSCETTNNGDPIVLYDQLADRWVMSQLALPNWLDGPFYQCIAVSQSSDPFGPWARAEYLWPSNRLNDYPKLAVWPNSYTLTVNEFGGQTLDWKGAAVVAYDREALLNGTVPQMLYFDLGTGYGGLLPTDLDGHELPPEGAPATFFGVENSFGGDSLKVWELDVDWSDVGTATFGDGAGNPNSSIPVESFATLGSASQPSGASLDVLSDRLMFRTAYRNFGTHESVVINHSVRVTGRNGIRWYEVRDPAGTPVLWQHGTYSPDSDHRWMGSIAMDAAGNIGVGYSVSSNSTPVAIRYTGRQAGDPLGEMTITETSIQEGSGSQLNSSRFGDYSAMTVDPVDDCTFWYTHEYMHATSSTAWASRIAAFRLPGCNSGGIFADGFNQGSADEWSEVVQ